MAIISISKKNYSEKPTGEEVAKTLQYQANFDRLDMTVTEFASYIEKGHAFRAANHVSGKTFTNDNVESSWLIALDFDHCDKDADHFIEYTSSMGIEPNL